MAIDTGTAIGADGRRHPLAERNNYLDAAPYRRRSNGGQSAAAPSGAYVILPVPAEEVLSHDDLVALGLEYWPDGSMGFRDMGDDVVYGYAANADNVAVVELGAGRRFTVESVVDASLEISGVDPSLVYAAGGPIYTDPVTGKVAMIYHGEVAGDPVVSSIGVAVVGESSFDDLGLIITQPEAGAGVEMGSGALVVANGFVYVYTCVNGRSDVAVARCTEAAFRAAINAGNVPAFFNYHDGAWTESALGGDFTPLGLGPSAWIAGSYFSDLGLYVIVKARGEVTVSTSRDGITFTDPMKLSQSVGIEAIYATILGARSGVNRGADLSVIWTDSATGGVGRWADATVQQATATFKQVDAAVVEALAISAVEQNPYTYYGTETLIQQPLASGELVDVGAMFGGTSQGPSADLDPSGGITIDFSGASAGQLQAAAVLGPALGGAVSPPVPGARFAGFIVEDLRCESAGSQTALFMAMSSGGPAPSTAVPGSGVRLSGPGAKSWIATPDRAGVFLAAPGAEAVDLLVTVGPTQTAIGFTISNISDGVTDALITAKAITILWSVDLVTRSGLYPSTGDPNADDTVPSPPGDPRALAYDTGASDYRLYRWDDGTDAWVDLGAGLNPA